MQLKQSGIQVPLTNNPESRNQDCLGFPYVGHYSSLRSRHRYFLGAKRENSRTRARGKERRGHLLSPSRVPLAQPLKKVNRCLLLRLQYRGSRVFNSLRATDNSHTPSEVTRSNLNHKARFGSYEAQKSYTLQQEWEKNARIFPSVFPSVPYN